MAIAAGVLACKKGYEVRFYTVTELVLNEDYGLPGSTCPDFGKHDSV